jgi:hypothetical protein
VPFSRRGKRLTKGKSKGLAQGDVVRKRVVEKQKAKWGEKGCERKVGARRELRKAKYKAISVCENKNTVGENKKERKEKIMLLQPR